MIGGFNENVEHNGKVYHVQTENLGIDKAIIRILVYDGGTVIVTRQTNYQKLRDKKTPKELNEIIDEIIKKQHRLVIEELLSGKFDKAERAEKIEKKEQDPLANFLQGWCDKE